MTVSVRGMEEERLSTLPLRCLGLCGGFRFRREGRVALATDEQGHALVLLVGEACADRLAALLAGRSVLEDVEVGNLFRLRGRFGCGCHGLSPFCYDPFGRCLRSASSRARRHTGKLEETFRGNRGFLLTQGAHANGRGLEHARWGIAQEKADDTEKPAMKQGHATRSIKTGAGKCSRGGGHSRVRRFGFQEIESQSLPALATYGENEACGGPYSDSESEFSERLASQGARWAGGGRQFLARGHWRAPSVRACEGLRHTRGPR